MRYRRCAALLYATALPDAFRPETTWTRQDAASTTSPPPVAIIMGSRSDWPTLRHAAQTLDALRVAYVCKVVSAHRTPERLYAFAKGAKAAGAEGSDRRCGRRGAPARHGTAAHDSAAGVLGVPIRSEAF